jgi:hypothetical protein
METLVLTLLLISKFAFAAVGGSSFRMQAHCCSASIRQGQSFSYVKAVLDRLYETYAFKIFYFDLSWQLIYNRRLGLFAQHR